MNIAAALPTPGLIAPNLDMTAGLLMDSGIDINFAAVLETAAGLCADTAGDQQTDAKDNLEQAMQMMAAQIVMPQLIQPEPQDEIELPVFGQTVMPAVQAASETTITVSTIPLQTVGTVTMPVVKNAGPENNLNKQDQNVEQFAVGLKTAAAEPLQAPGNFAAVPAADALTAAVPTDAAPQMTTADIATVTAIFTPAPAISAASDKTAKIEKTAEFAAAKQSAAESLNVELETAVKPVKSEQTSAQGNQSESKNDEKPAKSSPPSWASAWQNAKPADHSHSVLNTVPVTGLETDTKAANGNLIVNQIIDQAEMTWQNGDQVIEIKLRPDSFGELQIRLTRGEDGITAQIRTDNAQTGDLLNTQISQLQDSLKNKGLTFTQINVQFFTAGSDLASRQQSQSSQTDRQQSQTRKSSSRISRSISISATESAPVSSGTPWTRAGKIDYMA